jgi:uncharacterized protein YcgI (DUF1989 family)
MSRWMESNMSKSRKIERVWIPAAHGGTIDVKKGQYICVLDVEGGQCADFWAIDRNDFDHVMSPLHFFIGAMKIQPKVGDKIVTNRRDPIVTIVYDDVGWHDMLVPSCDRLRYEYHYGVKGHRNCCDNFHEAMRHRGSSWGSRPVPHPFNIFMNSFVKEDGTLIIRVPTSKAGDRVIMLAEMDIIAVASSCPMDLNETGARGVTDVELLVSDSFEALQNAKIEIPREM